MMSLNFRERDNFPPNNLTNLKPWFRFFKIKEKIKTLFNYFFHINLFKDDLNNQLYHLFFQNMTQVNGFKGFVGFGIRELDSNETKLYCFNQRTTTRFPQIQTQVNFTSDFMIRTYSSGCYFYDANTGKWCSSGMDIYGDTNFEQTHCMSNHLTSFAGGFVLLPSKINISCANTIISRNKKL